MTVSPIHLLELLTLGLILLSIYRIFKNLALETANNTFQQVLSDLPAAQERIDPIMPPKLELVKPLESKTLNSLNKLDNTPPQKSTIKSTNTDLTEKHQTALKNYIGDFF